MVFIRAQSECPASRQVGSFIRVSTASSATTDSLFTRGARYWNEGRVLLTVSHSLSPIDERNTFQISDRSILQHIR